MRQKFRSHLKNVFWPPACGGIGASFQIFEILKYSCCRSDCYAVGLKLAAASKRYFRTGTSLACAWLALFSFVGCAASHQNYRNSGDPSMRISEDTRKAYLNKTMALRDDLAKLNGQADLTEANQVAETAITYADDLIAEYNLVRPAVFHNVLVRIGAKDRGLCYHWTEDLMKRLQSLKLKTFQLHWGVAYRGSELREHNTVIITAKGRAFEQGMVLDPWRNSGDLYWAPVKKDSYPWEERPPEEW